MRVRRPVHALGISGCVDRDYSRVAASLSLVRRKRIRKYPHALAVSEGMDIGVLRADIASSWAA